MRMILWLVMLQASLAASSPLDDYFELLKDDRSINLSNHGYVCEALAREEFSLTYDSQQYDLYTGIVYGRNGMTIGELDLAIRDRESGEVVLVAEVKCKRRVGEARRHAEEQLQRFVDSRDLEGLELFWSYDQSVEFEIGQFDRLENWDDPDTEENEDTMITVSQKSSGFDVELSLSYDEVIILYQRLVQYRRRHLH